MATFDIVLSIGGFKKAQCRSDLVENKPLVSVAMTVYNGEKYLREALDSLLSQDYGNFELIILYNQSTDQTQEICLQFAKKDPRIRYVLDNQMRNGHDAATHIASFAQGEFYMCACDDDLWETSYITKLVSVLNSDSTIGLVYSNGYFINEEGQRTGKMLRAPWKFLKHDNSKLYNFCHFLWHRNVVPVALGIYRTDLYKRMLPFCTFDATVADVDNLFILKALTFAKVHSVDEPLLYYRVYPVHERWEDPEYGRYPQNRSRLFMKVYYLVHELKFLVQIFKVIDQSPLSLMARCFLKVSTLLANLSRILLMPIYSGMRRFVKAAVLPKAK